MTTRSAISRRELISLRPRAPGRIADMVHIASLLVQTSPNAFQAARQAAAVMPGAELHATAAPGKFVVVLESADDRAIADAADALLQVSGVLTVSIVAHLMEPAASLDEEV